MHAMGPTTDYNITKFRFTTLPLRRTPNCSRYFAILLFLIVSSTIKPDVIIVIVIARNLIIFDEPPLAYWAAHLVTVVYESHQLLFGRQVLQMCRVDVGEHLLVTEVAQVTERADDSVFQVANHHVKPHVIVRQTFCPTYLTGVGQIRDFGRHHHNQIDSQLD